MKITIRKDSKGILCAYIPRTDLEEPIVSIARARMWGGLVTLANGWKFELPEMAPDTVLPVTVEARRLAGGHD
ncbi:putative nitrogen fixation protein NifT [Paraburkholderia phymatum]|uniref:Nitrogen fixation protein NifT n=1 Tax=Paraburkholderia phymatum TaxID=148447 RepID=A0ACC6UEK0_9BURK